ncbi:probable ATP-dependent RNA helicase vasa-like [Dermacentor silvarum]|uniref:probable ATP-dependent RNA helicase vasa-like n=1 Tax=Dermacentor silvarum TaxID=543639 RepID=UPI0021007ACF|nr:probable ATP-dependent RNA helicase vasa-like [Dermacentor silvarum]
MEAATSRRPCGAGWGAMGSTWHKNVRNRGVLAAGADCWGEDTPEKEQLTFIYGGVRHSERGRSASSTGGRAHFEGNQEGHMSRECLRHGRGCFKCSEEGHMSRD